MNLDKDHPKRKVIENIISNLTASELQNKNFKIHALVWVNCFDLNSIMNKVKKAVSDIQSNKNIDNKAGIMIHHINLL